MRISDSSLLRAKLAMLQARYDHGACSGLIYKIIKELQHEIAWLEHRKPPIDRGHIQYNWPMGMGRRRNKDK
jgi:hypothetical protein